MSEIARREFIRRSVAIGAGIALVGPLGRSAGAVEPIPGSRMKLGLVTYLWAKDWDLPTLLANCEKTNVLGVELRTTHGHGVEPTLDAKAREEVKKRFADSPVTYVGIGSNECFDNPDPEVLNKAVEATKEFLILCKDTGGSGVKVKPNSFHEGVPREKTIEQIGKALNVVGAFGADLGQEIRLEVHGQCAELPIMKQILDIADHPNVKVCWNSNDKDLEGEGLEYNFGLVKDRFGATAHVRDLPCDKYPFEELAYHMLKMDYSGWLLLECHTTPPDTLAALAEQPRRWREMIAKAQARLAAEKG